MRLAICHVCLALMLCCAHAMAQEQAGKSDGEAPEGIPRVSLSEITANPGQSLMIPLYFTPDPQNPLRSFSVEIEYVSNSLKFNSAEPGDPLSTAGGKLEAVLRS